MRQPRAYLSSAVFCAALAGLAACNGTAVVTLTSTASQDNFLAYRVGLANVQLTSSGKSGLTILPASTTVDLASLTDVSEVLGAAAVAKGTYESAVVTLDYSSAQIVYDDGTETGVPLTPVGANGRSAGKITLTVNLDPSDSFSVSSKGASQLAMNINLAATNVVNLSAKTVTVTPMVAASALPIDSKQVRIRGPLVNVGTAASTATATSSFLMGVMPFNGAASGAGRLSIVVSDATTFEVNGSASSGASGMTQLGALGTGTLAVAYGTLTTADTTTTTTVNGATSTSNAADVSFAAAQVLAGSSVQGGGFDRVSGVVSARGGNFVTIEDGTLVGNDGVEAFIPGTTTVSLGSNTAVTTFGQSGLENNSQLQVSVGSAVDVFGVAASVSSNNITLDASAGRVRLDNTTASGLVTAQSADTLNLGLVTLGGRAVRAFDFADSGAVATQYIVNTGGLDLANPAAGTPVIVTGLANSFGVTPPNFIASALLDPTTIQAELIVDWGAGTATPFTTFDSTAIDLDARNSSIGPRHQIQIGAQTINVVGMTSDPLIVPDTTGTNAVYAIGHASSSTVDTFDSYAAFITQLQTELDGVTLATGITAVGLYTASTFTLTASSITLFLNN